MAFGSIVAALRERQHCDTLKWTGLHYFIFSRCSSHEYNKSRSRLKKLKKRKKRKKWRGDRVNFTTYYAVSVTLFRPCREERFATCEPAETSTPRQLPVGVVKLWPTLIITSTRVKPLTKIIIIRGTNHCPASMTQLHEGQ